MGHHDCHQISGLKYWDFFFPFLYYPVEVLPDGKINFYGIKIIQLMIHSIFFCLLMAM